MEHFDINNIIMYYKPDLEELAKVLFPFVKYHKQAFDRILKGEAELSTSQIESLASYLGVLVSDLFSIENSWKGTSEDECLTITKGEYKVKLNYKGVFVSIYKNSTLIDNSIGYIPNMTVKEFINYIDNQIKKYENGNN